MIEPGGRAGQPGEGGQRPPGLPTMTGIGEAIMPWLAQRPDLPDTHKHWADPGSELERVYVRLGYVEVPAPGSAEPDEQGLDQQPVTDVATAAADRPKRGSGRA